jgi:exonuclease SbcD
MRILHTADWHLGKKLNEYIDLIEVQEDLLNQIQNILKEEEIDVFCISRRYLSIYPGFG